MYRLRTTKEVGNDVDNLVAYMIYSLKNGQAASNFLDQYEKQIQNLTTFPFGYVDTKNCQITILRVLKDRQNWKTVLHNEDEYSF